MASSFGSVPVMELFRIAKRLRLLRLAHAASGSVPACKHPLPHQAVTGQTGVASQHQHTHLHGMISHALFYQG